MGHLDKRRPYLVVPEAMEWLIRECLNSDMISMSRAAEYLNIDMVAMRELSRKWDREDSSNG